MKIVAIGLFLCLSAVNVLAQSNNPQTVNLPVQSQSFQDLVDEVRQLRLEVQRLGAASYRSQVMVERLKIQKEQVARLTHELNQTREKLSEGRARQGVLKMGIEALEKGVEAGTKNPTELKTVAAELEASKQREVSLMEQETRIAAELEMERGGLSDLNRRLDELEQEIKAPAKSEERRPNNRR